jgi:hypothetical protein
VNCLGRPSQLQSSFPAGATGNRCFIAFSTSSEKGPQKMSYLPFGFFAHPTCAN